MAVWVGGNSDGTSESVAVALGDPRCTGPLAAYIETGGYMYVRRRDVLKIVVLSDTSDPFRDRRPES